MDCFDVSFLCRNTGLWARVVLSSGLTFIRSALTQPVGKCDCIAHSRALRCFRNFFLKVKEL